MTTKRNITFSVPTYRLAGALDACLQRWGSVTVHARDNYNRCLLDVECDDDFYGKDIIDDFCKRYASTVVEGDVADDDLDKQMDDLMKKVSKQPECVRQQVAATIMQYCTITTEVKPAQSESDAFYIETELEID